MQRAEEFPEEGELIIGTVQTVKNYGAFVILDEYENKEGFIHITEVATGWIKYIRDYVRERIKEIGKADILAGIPCYNEENSIKKVVEVVGRGLAKHYPGKKAVLIVSDGGSLDDTREVAIQAKVPQGVEKIITILD